MKMTRISTTLILLLGLSLSVMAQPNLEERKEKRKEMREKREALHEEVSAYAEENIAPVMLTQRNKLNAYLSAEEQQTLEEIRTQMKADREEMKVRREAMREKMKDHKEKGERPVRPELTEAQREEFKARREARKAQMEQLRSIAEAHKEEMKGLMEEISAEREQWKSDIEAIAAKYIDVEKMKERRAEFEGEGKPERGRRGPGKEGMDREKGEGPMGMRGGGPGGRGMRGGMKPGAMHPVRFLLMEPEEVASALLEDGELVIYPNPTTTLNTITFEVKQAGPVQVQLINQQGEVIKSVVNEFKEAGSYTEMVDLTSVTEGIYIYRIKTAEGIQTKKVVVDK